MRRLLLCFLLCCRLAGAEESLSVCFNYSCMSQAEVSFAEEQLDEVRALLADALDAGHERALLAVAIGRLLGWAGKQSPIHVDRGGNADDEGVSGKMDCIDHSTTTTRLLKMLERRGLLRWHRVLAPVQRTRLLIFDHWSAVIEEAGLGAEPKAPRYVVDSWFRDNGRPAVIMPLQNWMDWKDVGDDD